MILKISMVDVKSYHKIKYEDDGLERGLALWTLKI
jgi:hypothetical protein